MNLSFQSARLTYSPIQLSDAEDVFAYAKDPEVAKFTSWEAHQSIQETESFLRHVIGRHQENPRHLHIVFVIRPIRSRRVIGTISVSRTASACVHIDYALSRMFWGQGIMTESVHTLADWAFDNLKDLAEIRSGCLALNCGSVRVLEKCGFIPTKRYNSIRNGKFGGKNLETIEFTLERKQSQRINPD